MPLTISHVAAVLPARRLPIVLSAFVVGTMAPDFEYFVRLAPQSRWSHHFPGVFILTLPVALLVLWIYDRWMKAPAVALLPDGIQQRLPPTVSGFALARRPIATVSSVLGGIASHVLWDMFTHRDSPMYWHWTFMRKPVVLPCVGVLRGYKILQLASTVAGLLALLIWFALWYRRTSPRAETSQRIRHSVAWKTGLVALMLALAAVAACTRGLLYAGLPHNRSSFTEFAGVGFATAVTALWLQMLLFGFIWRARHRADTA